MEAGDCMAESVITSEPSSAFDPSRAALFNRDVFAPFRVRQYEQLIDLVESGRIRPRTPVLVTELPTQPVALITTQMAYHHVAQGDIAGKPWLVSF